MTEKSFSEYVEEELAELLRKSKDHVMTEEEKKEQRISFVYGNTRLANEAVTEEMVRRIAEEMEDD